MSEQTITTVSFQGHEYSITSFGDRFGVCRGVHDRIKYMPVVWKYDAHNFPELHKTRLSFTGAAEDLVEAVATCARISCAIPECIRLCEHVLRFGHTPR